MKIILNSLPKLKRMIRYSIIRIMTNLVQSALQSDHAVDRCLCKEYVIKCNLEGCFANAIIHLPKVYIYSSIYCMLLRYCPGLWKNGYLQYLITCLLYFYVNQWVNVGLCP